MPEFFLKINNFLNFEIAILAFKNCISFPEFIVYYLKLIVITGIRLLFFHNHIFTMKIIGACMKCNYYIVIHIAYFFGGLKPIKFFHIHIKNSDIVFALFKVLK